MVDLASTSRTQEVIAETIAVSFCWYSGISRRASRSILAASVIFPMASCSSALGTIMPTGGGAIPIIAGFMPGWGKVDTAYFIFLLTVLEGETIFLPPLFLPPPNIFFIVVSLLALQHRNGLTFAQALPLRQAFPTRRELPGP